MNRSRRTYSLIVICSLLLVRTAFVQAEEPIAVQVNDHQFAFGHQIHFGLQVSSSAPLQSIVLAYRTSDTQGTTIQTIPFDPALAVTVVHVHDIEQRYIRPFVDVTYWWTILDAAGNKLITEPQSFAYTDNRFSWQIQSRLPVTVHWYDGDAQIAAQALDLTAQAIERARQDIDPEASLQPIDVYLYANVDDLRLALPSSQSYSIEALTLYETSVVLVPYGPQSSHIPNLERILPHEVTHALIHQATENDFDRVPRWLSEGLATSVEYATAPNPDARILVEEALREDRLLDLNVLCADFPRDVIEARLAYAESASLVNYIRDVYGRQTVRDLFAAYADGATCEGGAQRALGFSLDRLQALWQESLMPRSGLALFWQANGAWIVLFAIFAGLPLILVGRALLHARTSPNDREEPPLQ